MRSSDWSSDVCSSDLRISGAWRQGRGDGADRQNPRAADRGLGRKRARRPAGVRGGRCDRRAPDRARVGITLDSVALNLFSGSVVQRAMSMRTAEWMLRSEEHTSELQSLMRISYAVFCLKKKKKNEMN